MPGFTKHPVDSISDFFPKLSFCLIFLFTHFIQFQNVPRPSTMENTMANNTGVSSRVQFTLFYINYTSRDDLCRLSAFRIVRRSSIIAISPVVKKVQQIQHVLIEYLQYVHGSSALRARDKFYYANACHQTRFKE